MIRFEDIYENVKRHHAGADLEVLRKLALESLFVELDECRMGDVVQGVRFAQKNRECLSGAALLQQGGADGFRCLVVVQIGKVQPKLVAVISKGLCRGLRLFRPWRITSRPLPSERISSEFSAMKNLLHSYCTNSAELHEKYFWQVKFSTQVWISL